MLKKWIERQLGKKTLHHIRVGLKVAALVCAGYVLWQVFAPSGIPLTSSPPGVGVGHGLVAIPAKGVLGGVLAGFAYYFAFPLWLLRILYVVAVITLDGSGVDDFLIIVYILCWIFMPSIDFVPVDFIIRTG